MAGARPVQGEEFQSSSFAPSAVNSHTTGSGQTKTVQLTQGTPGVQTPADTETETTTPQRKRPVAEIIERLGNTAGTPKTTAVTGSNTSRPNALGDAVKQASDGVKKTVDSVNDGFKQAVGDVSKAVSDTAKKMSDAAKPKPASDASE